MRDVDVREVVSEVVSEERGSVELKVVGGK